MDYKSSEIKAGIFIVISLVIFIVFLAIIVGMNSLSEKVNYVTRFNYVGGVEKGSAVRYAGMQVGSVVDVRIAQDGFPGAEVVMQVTKETPIREDSRAYMTTIGLMGSVYIEITSGSNDSPLLSPDAMIPSNEVKGFAQISGPAADAMVELTDLLQHLNEIFNEHNRRLITDMIESMVNISKVTEGNLTLTLENMNQLIDEADELTRTMQNVVASNDSAISNSFHHLEVLLSQSIQTLDRLDGFLVNVDHSFFENQQHYDQIMRNLNALTQNLNEFSQSIKERPWSVIRKSVPTQRELD